MPFPDDDPSAAKGFLFPFFYTFFSRLTFDIVYQPTSWKFSLLSSAPRATPVRPAGRLDITALAAGTGLAPEQV